MHTYSKPFKLKIGVRQGETSSPKLFTACLEKVFLNLNWNHKGIKIDGEYLNYLRFADDIILFSSNPRELQQMQQELNQESLKFGLSMNIKKTKIMKNELMNENMNIIIGGNEIEVVQN